MYLVPEFTLLLMKLWSGKAFFVTFKSYHTKPRIKSYILDILVANSFNRFYSIFLDWKPVLCMTLQLTICLKRVKFNITLAFVCSAWCFSEYAIKNKFKEFMFNSYFWKYLWGKSQSAGGRICRLFGRYITNIHVCAAAALNANPAAARRPPTSQLSSKLVSELKLEPDTLSHDASAGELKSQIKKHESY